MARIEKRARTGGRTVYIAKWLTITGQDRSKTFPTKKDAEAHLTKPGFTDEVVAGGGLEQRNALSWWKNEISLGPNSATTKGIS